MKRLFVLIVILLAACGGTTTTEDSPDTAPEPPKEQTFSTLEAAMNSGLGMKCTFDYQGNKGTVAVKGEMYHTEVTADGQRAHSMSDGENMYVWAEGQEEGIMITKAQLEEAEKEQGEDVQYGMFDTEQEYDFVCLPSVVSGTSFVPPSDVTFIDVETFVEQLVEGMFE